MHVEGLLASRAEDTKSSRAQYSLSTEDSDLKECLAASSLAASAGLCVRPHGDVMSGTHFDRLAQLPAPPCGCRFEHYRCRFEDWRSMAVQPIDGYWRQRQTTGVCWRVQLRPRQFGTGAWLGS